VFCEVVHNAFAGGGADAVEVEGDDSHDFNLPYGLRFLSGLCGSKNVRWSQEKVDVKKFARGVARG
jgi:hypothetical protein